MGGDQNSSASFPLGVEVPPLTLSLKFTLSVVEGKGALPHPAVISVPPSFPSFSCLTRESRESVLEVGNMRRDGNLEGEGATTGEGTQCGGTGRTDETVVTAGSECGAMCP